MEMIASKLANIKLFILFIFTKVTSKKIVWI